MKIQIKNIKQIVGVSFFLIIFSLSYFVFASVDEAVNKNFLLDSDQDGLTDEEEKTYGTDPYKADSDEDGYSDGVEVKNGYNPLKPAPGDKLVDEKKYVTASADTEGLTEKLSTELKPLLTATEDDGTSKEFSVEDIDEALDKSLGDSVKTEISSDSLPEFFVPEDKILKQDYDGLSDAEKREQLKADTNKYIEFVAYVFANNLPEEVASPEDLKPFANSLVEHLNDLGKTPPDYSYYRSLKSHVQIIVDELSVAEVPENMVSLHVELVRLLKAYLAIGETAPVGASDPVALVVFMNNVEDLNNLTSSFLQKAYQGVAEYIVDSKE